MSASWEEHHARNTDPDTSHAAAQPTQRTFTLMGNLYKTYKAAYQNGMGLTASEAATAAGYTDADGAWKRVSDLLKMGLLVDTGIRRPGPHHRKQRVLRWVDPKEAVE